MTDPEALLAAHRADPEEDTIRLAYADAVEEAGDPDLAALVRVGVLCSCAAGPREPKAEPVCGGCDGRRWLRRCEHEGCRSAGDACFLSETEHTDNAEPPPDGHYCAEHAFEHGFCMGCGVFWAGVEEFDFGNGLCPNCRDSSDDEDFYDWDEDEWDGDVDGTHEYGEAGW